MTPDLLKDAVSPILRARGTSVLLAALLSACGGKDVRPETPPEGDCAPLRLEREVNLEGFRTDRYEWRDEHCKPRSASLVRNDAPDPADWTGGYVRRYTYDVAGATRVCDGSDEVPGWGIVASHLRASETWGNWTEKIQGTGRTVFEGRHHALHEFRWPLTLDGHVVNVTVHYLFATGRSHPLYAITHDASLAPPDAIHADVRSPYGDMRFDGDGNADITGVGWGDRYRFTTLSADGVLSRANGWDYREPNVVPYTRMFINPANAEMGVVQTQTWEQKPAGGYWNYATWGQVDVDGPLPEDWNWTYQLNQYQLPEQGPTRSHRMAWGSNFGALGYREYPRYGDDGMLSGYPYQSYSVFMVLGTKASDPVFSQVSEVETWQLVRFTASEGRVLEQGPGGVGRDDQVAFDVPGYNPVYATWEAEVAANNRASLHFDAGTRGLRNPVLVLRGYTASTPPARVTLDGTALTADVDYFASVDDAGNALWLTLAKTLNRTAALHIE